MQSKYLRTLYTRKLSKELASLTFSLNFELGEVKLVVKGRILNST